MRFCSIACCLGQHIAHNLKKLYILKQQQKANQGATDELFWGEIMIFNYQRDTEGVKVWSLVCVTCSPDRLL